MESNDIAPLALGWLAWRPRQVVSRKRHHYRTGQPPATGHRARLGVEIDRGRDAMKESPLAILLKPRAACDPEKTCGSTRRGAVAAAMEMRGPIACVIRNGIARQGCVSADCAVQAGAPIHVNETFGNALMIGVSFLALRSALIQKKGGVMVDSICPISIPSTLHPMYYRIGWTGCSGYTDSLIANLFWVPCSVSAWL